jgi:hypothetical protein
MPLAGPAAGLPHGPGATLTRVWASASPHALAATGDGRHQSDTNLDKTAPSRRLTQVPLAPIQLGGRDQ